MVVLLHVDVNIYKREIWFYQEYQHVFWIWTKDVQTTVYYTQYTNV